MVGDIEQLRARDFGTDGADFQADGINVSIFSLGKGKWRVIDKNNIKIQTFSSFGDVKQNLIHMYRENRVRKYKFLVNNYKEIQAAAEIRSMYLQSDGTRAYNIFLTLYCGDSEYTFGYIAYQKPNDRVLKWLSRKHIDAIMRDFSWLLKNGCRYADDALKVGVHSRNEVYIFCKKLRSVQANISNLIGCSTIDIKSKINPSNELLFDSVGVIFEGTDWNHTRNTGVYIDLDSAKSNLSKSFMKNTHTVSDAWVVTPVPRLIDVDFGYRICEL